MLSQIVDSFFRRNETSSDKGDVSDAPQQESQNPASAQPKKRKKKPTAQAKQERAPVDDFEKFESPVGEPAGNDQMHDAVETPDPEEDGADGSASGAQAKKKKKKKKKGAKPGDDAEAAELPDHPLAADGAHEVVGASVAASDDMEAGATREAVSELPLYLISYPPRKSSLAETMASGRLIHAPTDGLVTLGQVKKGICLRVTQCCSCASHVRTVRHSASSELAFERPISVPHRMFACAPTLLQTARWRVGTSNGGVGGL